MDKKTSALMNITLEECAEVVQAISKIFRFGFSATHPNRPNETNLMHLEEEIGDLLCMIDLLHEEGILDQNRVNAAALDKLAKLRKWAPEVF